MSDLWDEPFVHRVARAISGAPFPSKASFKKARAAIESMRRMNKAMATAAYAEHKLCMGDGATNKEPDLGAIWDAQISAALDDPDNH